MHYVVKCLSGWLLSKASECDRRTGFNDKMVKRKRRKTFYRSAFVCISVTLYGCCAFDQESSKGKLKCTTSESELHKLSRVRVKHIPSILLLSPRLPPHSLRFHHHHHSHFIFFLFCHTKIEWVSICSLNTHTYSDVKESVHECFNVPLRSCLWSFYCCFYLPPFPFIFASVSLFSFVFPLIIMLKCSECVVTQRNELNCTGLMVNGRNYSDHRCRDVKKDMGKTAGRCSLSLPAKCCKYTSTDVSTRVNYTMIFQPNIRK